VAVIDPPEAPLDADDSAADQADAGIRKPVALRFLEDVPSWLSSGVFHLSMMLLLSLLVVNAPKGDLGLDVELSGGSGGPQGGEDVDAAAAMQSFDNIAPPTAVDLTAPPVESLTTQPLELATTSVPTFDAAELSGGTAANPGNGDGRGSGDGVSGEGSGYGTAPTKTQLFGLREEAESFVYVFDRSDSMNSAMQWLSEEQTVVNSITPLKAAKAELLRSLEDLDPRQRFQIILYNHTTLPFLQDSFAYSLIPGTESNRKRANAFVMKQPGEGGTYHLQPLEMALKLRPEVIYLMTDGEAKDDPTSAELKQLRNLNRRRSRINVIHFCFEERPASTLSQLAKENRGQFVSINISRLAPGMRNNFGAPAAAMPDAAGDFDLPEAQAAAEEPEEPAETVELTEAP
jgi:hypothetical protein